MKLYQENLIRIDKLENTIIKIRKEEEESIEKAHVEAQTDDSVTCNECEFPANDIWELGEHIYEFHTLKDHGDFGGKRDLMVHRKNYHEDKVGVCRSYSSGNCTYTRDDCWWKHEKTTNNNEYICTHCDEKFNTKNKWYTHRTKVHFSKKSE